jgi:hypothetical protein
LELTKKIFSIYCCLIALAVSNAQISFAQQSVADSTKRKHHIALKLRNPVSDLVVLQLQDNLEFGVGDPSVTINSLEVQPVIPIVLNKNLRVVTRVTETVNHQWKTNRQNGKWGIGDLMTEFWLAPNYQLDEWSYGVGPVINFPAATDPAFGYQKWAAGPTVAAIKQKGGLTYGIILNHLWSFGGPGASDISITLVDPAISYTWSDGFSAGLEAQSNYDWLGEHWTIPLKGDAGPLIYIDKLAISVTLAGVYYVVRGPADPQWGITLTASFVIK